MVDARMFRSNGGCGYVKKPDLLMSSRPHNEAFNPKAKLPVKKTLKVKVYMGDGWHFDFKQTHFDLYSPPDFYTRVSYIAFLNQCSHDTTWFMFQWLTLIKTKFSSCKDRS